MRPCRALSRRRCVACSRGGGRRVAALSLSSSSPPQAALTATSDQRTRLQALRMADHTLSMLASSKVDPAGASVFFAGEGVESLMQVRPRGIGARLACVERPTSPSPPPTCSCSPPTSRTRRRSRRSSRRSRTSSSTRPPQPQPPWPSPPTWAPSSASSGSSRTSQTSSPAPSRSWRRLRASRALTRLGSTARACSRYPLRSHSSRTTRRCRQLSRRCRCAEAMVGIPSAAATRRRPPRLLAPLSCAAAERHVGQVHRGRGDHPRHDDVSAGCRRSRRGHGNDQGEAGPLCLSRAEQC